MGAEGDTSKEVRVGLADLLAAQKGKGAPPCSAVPSWELPKVVFRRYFAAMLSAIPAAIGTLKSSC
jgi:hypothetical protein